MVIRDMPKGGVDVFGCTARVRDELLTLKEAHSSLIGLIFWLGFRRAEGPYRRRARAVGVSAWTLKKKVNCVADRVCAFRGLPVRILSVVGFLGVVAAAALGVTVLSLKL